LATSSPRRPEYVGWEYIVLGVPCCEVVLDIPSTPTHPGWEPWSVVAHGYTLADTWETAGLEALIKFCEKHPEEIVGTPAAFFPVRDQFDPQWVAHIMDLDATTPGGAVLATMVSHSVALFNLVERQEAGLRVINRIRDYQIQMIQELKQKLSDEDQKWSDLDQYIDHLEEKLKEHKLKLAKLKEAKLKVPCDCDNTPMIEHEHKLKLAKLKEAKLKAPCDCDNTPMIEHLAERIEHFEEKVKNFELKLAKLKEDINKRGKLKGA
jgi:archaellum component FlaC